MSLSDTIMTWGLPVFAVIVTGICLLAVYRALKLRSVLVDPLYRRRALWTAIGALGLVGFVAATTFDSLVSSGYGLLANYTLGLVLEDVIWGLTFLAFYVWIYSSIDVALSTDYFHRDALWWKRGVSRALAATIILAYVLASLPPPSTGDASLLGVYNFVSFVVGILFAVVSAYAAIVLAIIYRRTRDRAIRNYTRWVALSAFTLVLVIVIPYNLGFLALILGAYSAYRAAGALSIRTHDMGKAEQMSRLPVEA